MRTVRSKCVFVASHSTELHGPSPKTISMHITASSHCENSYCSSFGSFAHPLLSTSIWLSFNRSRKLHLISVLSNVNYSVWSVNHIYYTQITASKDVVWVHICIIPVTICVICCFTECFMMMVEDRCGSFTWETRDLRNQKVHKMNESLILCHFIEITN